MGFLSSLRRDLTGGTDAYKGFNNQRNNWINNQIGPAPNLSFVEGELTGGDPNAYYNWNQQFKELQPKWLETLSPADRQQAESEFGLHSSDMDNINRYGSLAAKSLIGAIGGGLGMQALGASGLGGLFGGEAAVPTWDAATSAAWGSGSGLGGDTLTAMGLGEAGSATAAAPWTGINPALYPGPASGSNVMTGLEAGTGAGGSSISKFLSGLMPTNLKQGFNLAKSLSSLAGIYNNSKTSKGLTSLANNMASMYKPGSSYEQQLRKELERRDAMAGRRSQYGPRSVELQARLAEMVTRQSPKLAEMYMAADNSRNDMYKSLLNFGNSSGLLELFGG